MKQHITIEQLNELTEAQKERLIEWYISVGDYTRTPLLSIGQMMAFLFDNTNDWGMHYNDSGVFYTVYLSWTMDIARERGSVFSSDELCDALWNTTKHLLSLIKEAGE